jgi:hypothetical protein
MKKLLVLALLAVGMTAYAQEGRDKKDITLKDGENDAWTTQLAVGINLVTGAPDGYKFAPFKSWDINWTVVQYNYTPNGASQTYSAGVGLNWRNYGLKDNNTAFVKNGDLVGLGNFPEGAGSRYSSIRTLSISVPLLFTQKISDDFSFSVGPIVNFNAWGWVKRNYEMGDDDFEISTSKIGQTPVTIDVMGVFDFDGLGVFCKYSPMNVLKTDRGPKFQSVTVGLYL